MGMREASKCEAVSARRRLALSRMVEKWIFLRGKKWQDSSYAASIYLYYYCSRYTSTYWMDEEADTFDGPRITARFWVSCLIAAG